tara:strand:- start:1454 stop:1786 length:333 start_codon:yes stop_codon:yes gene_type:complete
MKRFDSQYGDNEVANRHQSILQESVGFLKDKEILDGKLIVVDVPSGTTVAVGHGLGRKFKGAFPVMIRNKKTGVIQTFDHFVPQASSDESLYYSLSILGGNELTVSFWIF